MHTLDLDREQLRAIREGLGLRIEQLRRDPRSYEPEDLDAALTALELVTDAEFLADHPELAGPRAPGMG